MVTLIGLFTKSVHELFWRISRAIINGANNMENLKAPVDTRKVRLIEEEFHALMVAEEGE